MSNSANYILSIDQGTTGSTVSIVDQSGTIVATADQEFPQIFPEPGWVEHDPKAIWGSVLDSLKACLGKFRGQAAEITAIGITNQRETVMVWDKHTGEPVYNAIVWQCRQTEALCTRLKKTKNKWVQKKTGLVLDPYFSASKIQWILENVPGARARAKRGDLICGTVDTFLLWKLTDGKNHCTDVSNASRTMLMNIHTGKWDKELLKLFSVPVIMLPQICSSAGHFGKTKGLGILPDGIAVTGIAGDQQAALFGQACFEKGEAKCTFGTGSFLLLNTGDKAVPSKAGMLTTIAWQLPGEEMTYALEGGAFICGAAVQWLRDGLGIIKNSSEIESLAKLETSTGGVEFVPALTGIGAPYWLPKARGMLLGLTRGTTRAHIARATLEAMALQNVEILIAMQKDSKKTLKALKVDGGATANNLLMQMQADYLGVKVVRPQVIESTTMGAAYLAGIGCGLWKGVSEIRKVWKVDEEFRPTLKQSLRLQRLKIWQSAIAEHFL